MEELEKYTKNHIRNDFKSLLNTIMNLAYNHCHYVFISMLLPYIYTYINECEKIIKKHNWKIDIQSEVTKNYSKNIFALLRAKAIKLYSSYNTESIQKLDNYLSDTTEKFLTYCGNTNNYFVAYYGVIPVCNYHLLSHLYYNFPLGDFSGERNSNVEKIIETITCILTQFLCFDNKNALRDIRDFKTYDYGDLTLEIKNYRLDLSKTKYIPFIDLLCVANFTKFLLPQLIKNDVLLTKITYISLYFGIKSLENLVKLLDKTVKIEPLLSCLKTLDDHENIIKNCRHYGFIFKSENKKLGGKDLFINDIENRLGYSYNCFKKILSEAIDLLIDTIMEINKFEFS